MELLEDEPGGSVAKGWTAEEDNKIVALVNEHGVKKWSIVAAELPGRNGKQCRERWHNQLDPSIKRGPWSFEEDQLLLRAHSEHGSKWSLIAKFLPGRTDNSIKNRWNSALRRELRKMNRAAEDAELGRASGDETLLLPEPVSGLGGGGGLLAPPGAILPPLVGPPTHHLPACAVPGQAGKAAVAPKLEPAAQAAGAELAATAHAASAQLRTELAALGESSTDDATKRLLRAQLIEQLRELNATWEETGASPSANHIQELGKQVSRLQDFCRDLVGSSLTRQQLEIASGNVPKRRQCMARGRRRVQRAMQRRRDAEAAGLSAGGVDEGAADAVRKRARGAAGGGAELGAGALAAGAGGGSKRAGGSMDAGPDESGESNRSDSELDDGDGDDDVVPVDLEQQQPPRPNGGRAGNGGAQPGAQQQQQQQQQRMRAEVRGNRPLANGHAPEAGAEQPTPHNADIPTLHGDADLRMGPASLGGFGLGPMLTPNGTNLLSFDVDELLQLTGATLADVLASPRGMPLVTLSPAGGLAFNFPTPRVEGGRDGGLGGAHGAFALPSARGDGSAQTPRDGAAGGLAQQAPAHVGTPAGGSGAVSELPSPATATAILSRYGEQPRSGAGNGGGRSAGAGSGLGSSWNANLAHLADMLAPPAPSPLRACAHQSNNGAAADGGLCGGTSGEGRRGCAGAPAAAAGGGGAKPAPQQAPLPTLGAHSLLAGGGAPALRPPPLAASGSGSAGPGSAGSPQLTSPSDSAAAPLLARKASSLSERRRPRGATNLHIAHAAGERPAAPPGLHVQGSAFSNERTPPSAPGSAHGGSLRASDADAAGGQTALPSASPGDPLAQAIASDVNLWLDAR